MPRSADWSGKLNRICNGRHHHKHTCWLLGGCSGGGCGGDGDNKRSSMEHINIKKITEKKTHTCEFICVVQIFSVVHGKRR